MVAKKCKNSLTQYGLSKALRPAKLGGSATGSDRRVVILISTGNELIDVSYSLNTSKYYFSVYRYISLSDIICSQSLVTYPSPPYTSWILAPCFARPREFPSCQIYDARSKAKKGEKYSLLNTDTPWYDQVMPIALQWSDKSSTSVSPSLASAKRCVRNWEEKGSDHHTATFPPAAKAQWLNPHPDEACSVSSWLPSLTSNGRTQHDQCTTLLPSLL